MINKENVEMFCSGDITKIENYDKAIADTTQTWCCHHRAGVLPCGRYSRKTLNKFGLYFNRPPEELIFVTKAEHQKIHQGGLKRPPRSERWIRNLSKSLKGNVPWNKGVFGKDNPQTGAKRSEETRVRIRSVKVGYAWYSNGETTKQFKDKPPKGWIRGRKIWKDA